MNARHLALCSSAEWAAYVEGTLMPWVLGGHDLGAEVLELGPGPGRTTDLLLRSVPHLTVVELDEDLAAALARRTDGNRVRVVCADATRSGLRGGRFSAVACFTMLHHLPSSAAQDALFAEVRRLLRPGGVFVGTDGLDTPARRELHIDDTFTPIGIDELAARLTAAGLVDASVDVDGDRLRFAARAAPVR